VSTGDFGAFHDGDLYITGRVKDLVIVDGRNHYPQDLEYSAQEASKALRTGFVAAFSVPANQLPDEVFENAHAGLKRDPADSSGPWGGFAKLVEGGAKVFGVKAALAALEEGEDHGKKLYREDLDKLDASTRSFVETELMPEQQQTHDLMSQLKHSVH